MSRLAKNIQFKMLKTVKNQNSLWINNWYQVHKEILILKKALKKMVNNLVTWAIQDNPFKLLIF